MTARLAGAGGRLNRLRKGASTLRRSKAPISAPRRHNLVLLDRHRVKEDFLCEKTGRETALRRPGKLKFIFCSGADLERADSALLHEAAELGDGDLCGNQPVSVTSFWRGGLRVYSEGAMKRLSALRFAHSSLSSPPRLSISTSEFAAPLCRCRRKNATVSGKTRPFLGKRSHLDTFRRSGGIACSIRRSAPTASIVVKAPSI